MKKQVCCSTELAAGTKLIPVATGLNIHGAIGTIPSPCSYGEGQMHGSAKAPSGFDAPGSPRSVTEMAH